MFTDYMVIEQPSPNGLRIKVKEAMAQGWQPLGGVGAYAKNTSTSLFQAMVYTPKEQSK